MGAIESTREFAELHTQSLATLPPEERNAVIQDLTEKIFEEIPPGTDVICTGQNICTFEKLENEKAESLGLDKNSANQASLELASTSESAAHGSYNGLELFWAEDLGQPEAIGQLIIGHVLLGSKLTYGLEDEILQISFCPVLEADLTAFEDPTPASFLGPDLTARIDALLDAEFVDFAKLNELFVSVSYGKVTIVADFLNYINRIPISERFSSVSTNNLFWGGAPAPYLSTCIDDELLHPDQYEDAPVDMQLGSAAMFIAGHTKNHENFLVVQNEDTTPSLFMPIHLISGYFKR